MVEVKGDLIVKRSLDARRMDNALSNETLAAARVVSKTDYKYLNLDPDGANRNVDLPDATTLTVGWSVIIRHSGSANNLVVRNNAAATIKTISMPIATAEERMYEFVLLTNGTAAGTWHVVEMGDPAVVVASRSVVTFTSGDWVTSGAYKILTGTEIAGFLAANHGRGTSPSVLVQELSGSDFDRVILDRERVLASGDIELRVLSGSEFNGRIVLV